MRLPVRLIPRSRPRDAAVGGTNSGTSILPAPTELQQLSVIRSTGAGAQLHDVEHSGHHP